MSRLRVAFQGEHGAFGDEAVSRQWAGAAEAIPTPTFMGVIQCVEQGRTDFGVVPVWNSLVGVIHSACDALYQNAKERTNPRLSIVGEVIVPVQQCLLALPGASLDSIQYVASHPVALAQCGRFLAAHPKMIKCMAYDTAGAALQLAQLVSSISLTTSASHEPMWYTGLGYETPEQLAVIASRRAAHQYDLNVLADNIQDRPDNVTQFFIVAHPERAGEARW